MSMDLLVRDLGVTLGGATILSGTGFTAKAGALTAIIGPSGCGKTTTLKALSGEIAYRGSIRLRGQEVSSLSPLALARMRAVLPQASLLAFPFTVREVVAMGLQAAGGRAGEDGRLIAAALEAVDLGGFAGRFYGELSGGEQQRAQLARALCQIEAAGQEHALPFLFLDEPVSSLDIRHQLSIMQLARAHARKGGGVVAVMHDLNLTAMFADNIVMMRAGRVEAEGTPDAVMTDPLLGRLFGCALRVGAVPPPPIPFVLPQTAIEP
ncbi:iron ABC transporter [Xaviernesmea oryzae]|uniref:Iron ABC transporter n=1 Tax=Xaviernesmea oryzae TaxID=464029 RepID=A0A1Q9B2S2_9HYPH|nr:heme ABC transporter ATP-binding protein [Xaviernesmea oryzae]OLP62310.1 iron ABC transporter [Xaviernesmea oryzae]SEL96387.1 iron complex transport system ATP-binding protein [Xaviernesmea oryzae]